MHLSNLLYVLRFPSDTSHLSVSYTQNHFPKAYERKLQVSENEYEIRFINLHTIAILAKVLSVFSSPNLALTSDLNVQPWEKEFAYIALKLWARARRDASAVKYTVQSPAPTWGLTTICISRAKGSDALLWSSQAPSLHLVHRHTCRQKAPIYIKLN